MTGEDWYLPTDSLENREALHLCLDTVTQCMSSVYFPLWIMTSDPSGGDFSKYPFIEIQFWNLAPPEGLHL